MPGVASEEGLKLAREKGAQHVEYVEPKPIQISVEDYAKFYIPKELKLQLIHGLGTGGEGLVVLPFTWKSYANELIQKAPDVDYEVPAQGDSVTIEIRSLPTHPILMEVLCVMSFLSMAINQRYSIWRPKNIQLSRMLMF
ncbi:MAG: hypothetical protein PHH37_09370 [Paludibacter sp.]|nr:hypothetical protein [Paludibacter sp.]